MTTTTALFLLDQIVTALRGHTDAGQSVFNPRDWPTWDGQYPCILTQVLSDTKQSQGRGSLSFIAVSTIRVICRAAAPGGDDDLGTSTAENEAWAMARQVEVAVINGPAVAPYVMQYPTIDSQVRVTSDGDQSVADVAVDIAMEYRLTGEDFASIATVSIAEQTAATSSGDFTNGTRVSPGMDLASSS